ncbi:MocR-like pyridoxine biosynthesis transcription factor PdxR [Deinococcus radiophilus]|uniref:MocR-like pyridoxine biosynthesis transcription factor PdxR n=1 Tax=Deinococcus radiophilus TaxID=32062 RepID=UPI001E6360AB|nr:PLP-dependent aminotransferase family protein [Deinococcus radiophilus]UFA50291.1 PLP-dependent aminotransferase family protein [Deinococcus radiophilus]
MWRVLTQLNLDRTSDTPLTRQLAAGLRALITTGQLPAGERLPPTRQLAAELGLSRGTVTEVFETLSAEGYLEGRVGAGTYVRALPGTQQPLGQASQRARLLASLEQPRGSAGPIRPLRHSRADPRLFPWRTWARLEAQTDWQPGLGASAAGWPPLREQVTAYLQRERGLACTPEQIIITTGTQQALDLAARTLLDHGEAAALENPGYPGTRSALLAAGIRPLSLRVDEGGLDTDTLWRQAQARLVCVAPAHQFPIGATLSPARRLELVRWAETRGSWILEDDYDSEYRYAGPPLTPLQASSRRVIHMGTFSAFLFSGLRLGFLVVPPELIGSFSAVKQALDRGSSWRDSATLARFMAEGHFARHLGRTRRIYAARHDLLAAEVQALGGQLLSTGRGLHLTAHWPQERALLPLAQRVGLDLSAVQEYTWGSRREPAPPGLLLGFAAYDAEELRRATRQMSELISSVD